MAEERDTTATIQSESGFGTATADTLDASALLDAENEPIAKRLRFVLGGELNREAVIEPVQVGGVWCVPVHDAEARRHQGRVEALLVDMLNELRRQK